MKFGYKFSNLLGTVYNKGNVLFTQDGNTLISPVGNRVTLFDLVNNTSVTLPVETNRDIEITALSPNGKILVLSDEGGLTYIVNLQRHVCLGTIKLHVTPSSISFSPNNGVIAFSMERKVLFYSTPRLEKSVNPITRQSIIKFQSLVNHVSWSPCSQKVVVCLNDSNIAVCRRKKGSMAILRTGGRPPKAAYFNHDGSAINVFTKTDVLQFNLKTRLTNQELAQQKINHIKNSIPNKKNKEIKVKVEGEEEEQQKDIDQDEEDQEMKEPEQEDNSDNDEVDEEDDEEDESDDEEDQVFEEEMEDENDEDDEMEMGDEENTKVKNEKKEKKEKREEKVKTYWKRGKRIPTGPGKSYAFAYHQPTGIAVLGQKSNFLLLETERNLARTLTMHVSNTRVTSIAINQTGEWIAVGCADLGQLLVWEWKSESYILKQQGHAYNMNTMAYSPDGQLIATGGDDSKVKVWNTNSGFCFVTFTEHEGPVTAVRFSPVPSQQVLFSAGLDGTVRAFDMVRYRNFRTFVSPNKTQYSCLAIDASGDIVVAGSMDTFEICVWSVRTGKLTDILSGHTSPVYGVSFNPITNHLASSSWDKTVRIWDIFDDSQVLETLEHTSDVLTCAYSPDGRRFASASLDGTIQIFETDGWTQLGFISGKGDLTGGRGANDITRNPTSQVFTKLVFTPNGSCLIAGGDSKYICIYHVEQQVLLKRYQTTYNLSMDGMLDYFRANQLSEFGFHLDTLGEDYEEDEDRRDRALPGAMKGDLAKRSTLRKIKTYALDVSPTGRAWSAVTTDGIVIYSLDDTLFFDPTDLTVDITPETILEALQDKQYLKSLVMSLKLNEKSLIEKVYQSIPYDDIEFVCHEFPIYHLKSLVQFLSYNFDRQPHIELQLRWALCLFCYHGKYLKDNSLSIIEPLRNLQKQTVEKYTNLTKVCDDNQYTLQYFEKISNLYNKDNVSKQSKQQPPKQQQNVEMDTNEEKEKEKEEKEKEEPKQVKKVKQQQQQQSKQQPKQQNGKKKEIKKVK